MGFSFISAPIYETFNNSYSNTIQNTRNAVTSQKSICLFAHFNAAQKVDEYVITYLEHLSSMGFDIRFISNSSIKRDYKDVLTRKIKNCRIFERHNKGADFGAWKWGMEQQAIPADTDYLLLTNDTLFGPIFPLAPIWEKMQALPDIDFWGLTESFQGQWHLQSYFLVLSKTVFNSDAFKRIFGQPFDELNKRQIIDRGEVLLSQSLSKYGFKGVACVPYNNLDPNFEVWDAKNPTHFFWDKLIEQFDFPFIKKELILQNPENIQNTKKLFALIKKCSSYPVENIKQSISEFLESSRSSYDFGVDLSVVCHLYYPGSIYYFLSQIAALNSPRTHYFFNLSAFLFHDDFFLEMLKKHFPGAVVIYTPNQGRDIGGKLAALDVLLKCNLQTDYTLIIHDKLSPHTPTGKEWRDKLFRVISPQYLPQIFKVFEQNPQAGLIGAKDFIQNEFDTEKNEFTCTSNENILKYIREYHLTTSDFNFTAGTIFWIRTEIVKNFFSLHSPLSIRKALEKGNSLDFDKGTNIHAWERLFSFIAHSHGFKTIGI